jgi:oxygen-independent coproporphyrinogen-3 oxidase
MSGRALDPARIKGLEGYGFLERTAQGRLRVTAEGFPLLDSVIAELAA